MTTEYSKEDFTLVLSPNLSMVALEKTSDVVDVLMNMITRDPRYFYCFWGCYGDPLPEDTTVTDYVEVGGKKYAKTKFTVVNGYENVRLEGAQDSTIYHLPESTYGDNGLQPQDITVSTYDSNGNPTSTVKTSIKVFPGEYDKAKDRDDRAYAISTSTALGTTNGVHYYSFAVIELPPNIPVLWTDKDRLGINIFDYDGNTYKDYRPEKYKYIMGNCVVY